MPAARRETWRSSSRTGGLPRRTPGRARTRRRGRPRATCARGSGRRSPASCTRPHTRLGPWPQVLLGDAVRPADDVERARLRLVEDVRHVLPNHAENYQLDPTDDADEDHDRGPAGDDEHSRELRDHSGEPEEDRRDRDDEADIQAEAKGPVREADDSVGGEPEHLHAAVLARPGRPGRGGLRDAGLPESDPAEHAAQITVRLAHRAHGVERSPVDESEVSGSDPDVDVGQPPEETVEGFRRPVLGATLAVALLHHRVDDLVPFAPPGEELRDHFRRMLEVAVHGDNGIAAGEVEPRRERDLVAEAAGQADDLEPWIPPVELDGEPVCGVRAPVVDEDDLPVAVYSLERRREARRELRQHLLLVAQRYHDGEKRRVVVHRVTRLPGVADV